MLWYCGVQVHFKGGNSIKKFLVAPKDMDYITLKNRVIYKYKCYQVDCEEEHIGESERTFVERLKEDPRASSLIFEHGNTSGNCISLNIFSIVGREVHNITRRPCTSGSMSHPLTGTLENSKCPIFGMRSC